jgi:hypothetical protein
MRFSDRIEYCFGGDDFRLPRMFRARQLFARDRLENIEAEVAVQLEKFPAAGVAEKRIALTAGSRGVADQARILRAVADALKAKGAEPFIVPGMGSHGGATAEGQREFIAGYGITEEAMGVPILSSMEVTRLGTTASGFPVYCDRNASEADFVLPVHRVKPHTDFKGQIESGLCKMMVIGLGKHRGATHIHRLGLSVFATLIPEAAQIFLDSGKVLGGVAVVENAYDETMLIEAVLPENLIAREKELLVKAKEVMAKFYLDSIDALIIEEVGKDISGAGMDSNITARPVTGEPGFEACPIKRIALLGISEQSHGNAIGFGVADVVTARFMGQVDLAATYINALTSRGLEAIRIPMIANDDRDAVKICVHCSHGVEPAKAKIVQIANTLRMSELLLSEPYLPLIRNDRRFETLSDPEPMCFDAEGALARLERGGH